MLLYRNAADKAFLSMIVAINSYINRRLQITPKSHSERRSLLKKIDREDLRALYSDMMRTLHDEAFYEGVYNPEEAKYAITQVKRMLKDFERAQKLLREPAGRHLDIRCLTQLTIPFWSNRQDFGYSFKCMWKGIN